MTPMRYILLVLGIIVRGRPRSQTLVALTTTPTDQLALHLELLARGVWQSDISVGPHQPIQGARAERLPSVHGRHSGGVSHCEPHLRYARPAGKRHVRAAGSQRRLERSDK